MNFFAIFLGIFLPWSSMNGIRDSKCFSLLFGLSLPVLAKNNAGKRFYNFLNFFTIFFRIFFPGSSMNGILEWNFVFTFSAYLIPFWLKIMPGGCFIIFWFFLQFFRIFLTRVEYERNSVVKFCFHFFGLSHPVLARKNAGKRFYNFLNCFTIFFGIFLLVSSMNGILE